MFSPLALLIGTFLLSLNTAQAFPKGGSDAYYAEHAPALVARYQMPPAYHNHDNSAHIAKRRQSKRAVCPVASKPATTTTAPTAGATQPAVKDDGTSTIFSTRTTTVWTTKTAAGAAAPAATTAATVKTAKDSDKGGLGPFTGVATWFNTSVLSAQRGLIDTRELRLTPFPSIVACSGLGACGWTNSPTDIIAAVSKDLFDTWPYVPSSHFYLIHRAPFHR